MTTCCLLTAYRLHVTWFMTQDRIQSVLSTSTNFLSKSDFFWNNYVLTISVVIVRPECTETTSDDVP